MPNLSRISKKALSVVLLSVSLTSTPGRWANMPGHWANTPGHWANTPGRWANTPGQVIMPPRIIPRKDADFNDYILRAIPYLQANDARLGVSGPNVNTLVGMRNDWNVLYPKTQNPDVRTLAITAQKNDLKKEITDLLRAVYRDIPESRLTQDDRATLNLKERDREPTRVAVPGHAPDVDIEKVEHRQVTLRLTDPENPDTKARPERGASHAGILTPGGKAARKRIAVQVSQGDRAFSACCEL